MKIENRGRAKFKPVQNLNLDEIKGILYEKIEKEKNIDDHEFELDGLLHYNSKKFNLLSLFCGAGGLDLGFELAGLQATIGDNKAMRTFYSKDKYNKTRSKSILIQYFQMIFSRKH